MWAPAVAGIAGGGGLLTVCPSSAACRLAVKRLLLVCACRDVMSPVPSVDASRADSHLLPPPTPRPRRRTWTASTGSDGRAAADTLRRLHEQLLAPVVATRESLRRTPGAALAEATRLVASLIGDLGAAVVVRGATPTHLTGIRGYGGGG